MTVLRLPLAEMDPLEQKLVTQKLTGAKRASIVADRARVLVIIDEEFVIDRLPYRSILQNFCDNRQKKTRRPSQSFALKRSPAMKLQKQLRMINKSSHRWKAMSGSLACGGCDSLTHVSSPHTCSCGRMLCGECGNRCTYHQNGRIVDHMMIGGRLA